MSSKTKKLKGQAHQIELLKKFNGDYYQEKKDGDKWLIKMWNGSTKKWQVATYSNKSYNAYKSFSSAVRDGEELDNYFNQNIASFEKPTLQNILDMAEKHK